jgi:hypothetical protein
VQALVKAALKMMRLRNILDQSKTNVKGFLTQNVAQNVHVFQNNLKYFFHKMKTYCKLMLLIMPQMLVFNSFKGSRFVCNE